MIRNVLLINLMFVKHFFIIRIKIKLFPLNYDSLFKLQIGDILFKTFKLKKSKQNLM
jgi:hypothetical protein